MLDQKSFCSEMARASVIGGKGSKFLPNYNVSHDFQSIDEVAWVNINRPSVSVTNEKPTHIANISRLRVGNETDVFTKLQDGSLRWDVEFAAHPGVYDWEWKIKCSRNVEFHYQPELTAQEISDGCLRPEEIVGSYAIYLQSGLRGYCKRSNGTSVNYRTGKLGHITRPLFIDGDGNKAWGTMHIDTSSYPYVMRVSVESAWLDNAAFPVLLDPTIGNTTVGASTAALNSSYMWGDGDFVAASGGDVESISVYNPSSSKLMTVGLYDELPSALVASTSEELHPGGGAWHTMLLSSSATIATGQGYWLIVSGPSGTSMSYDTVAGAGGNTNNHPYVAGVMPDPITMDSTSYNREISIYATYSESGGVVVSAAPASSSTFSVSGTELGSQSVQTDPAAAASRLLLDVALGSALVSPAAASSSALFTGGSAQLGSVVVAPTPALLRAVAIDPIVFIPADSPIVAPAPASAGSATIVSASLGSIVVSPIPVNAVAVTDNGVLIGDIAITLSPAASRAMAIDSSAVLGDVLIAVLPAQAKAAGIAPATGLSSLIISPVPAASGSDVAGATVRLLEFIVGNQHIIFAVSRDHVLTAQFRSVDLKSKGRSFALSATKAIH